MDVHALENQIKDLERRANSELDPKRREQLRMLANDLKRQLQAAWRPH